MMASTKLAATAPVPTTPICRSFMLRPFTKMKRNPQRGKRRISVATCAISTLHFRELVNRGRSAASEHRDDDAEPDGDFSRGDDHDEEDNGLTADVTEGASKRHEREVHGVQHQFDAHEHDERRAPGQESEGADAKEDGRQYQVPRG